jgi:hypothetical protein
VVRKHFVSKKLLKDNDGHEECVGLARVALGQNVLVSNEKIDSLGQELSGSQDMFHENLEEGHEDPLAVLIHDMNVIKRTLKIKYSAETYNSTGGTS